MWQRFSQRARKVVFYAQEEAGRLGENFVCSEHLLLGLVREHDSVAAHILDRIGVGLDRVRSEVERQLSRGPGRLEQDMQLTPRSKKVIDLAYDEARLLNDNHIGTQHLLLGLIREGEGLAGRVLSDLGVDLERTRREVTNLQKDDSSAGDDGGSRVDLPAGIGKILKPAAEVLRVSLEKSASEALLAYRRDSDLPDGEVASPAAGDDPKVAGLVEAIIEHALDAGAAEILLWPDGFKMRLQLFVQGDWQEVFAFPQELQAPLTARWKALAELDTSEHRAPQHGRVSLRHKEQDHELWVTVLPTGYGERVLASVFHKSIPKREEAQHALEPQAVPLSPALPSQRMAPPQGPSPIADVLTQHALRGRNILGIEQLSQDEILLILDVAARLKANKFDATQTRFAQGQTLAMLFEKPSLRTRVTFEAGMTQLGGHAIYLEGRLGVRESVPDVARNLGRCIDGIMARTFDHQTVVDLAAHSGIPVVNGLSDREHPCQALADFQTLAEHKGRLPGLKLVFVGDGNNVAQSLMLLAAKVAAHFTLVCPEGYGPDEELWQAALRYAAETGAVLTMTHDPAAGVAGADAVYTDVWTSMGQEDEAAERGRIFAPFQVNADLMAHAGPDALVMHCLPAHRGEEVTEDVIDGLQSVVLDQAENRLHAQKAILSLIL